MFLSSRARSIMPAPFAEGDGTRKFGLLLSSLSVMPRSVGPKSST